MNVFRYDGISLITGLPVNVNTFSSGIFDKILTIEISSMRLCDKSKMDNLSQADNWLRLSPELNKLCDRFNVFSCGSTDESQFSIDFM